MSKAPETSVSDEWEEYYELDESGDEIEVPDDWDYRREWVLDCGNELCCMPGYHFRYECHRGGREMSEAQNEEAERDALTKEG